MGKDRGFRLLDARKTEWWSSHNRIIDVFARELGPHATLVYLALVRHGNADPHVVIYLRTLCEELALSMTTVRAAIKRLERFDLVHVIEYIASTGQKPNEYVLLWVPEVPRTDWETREPPTRTRITPPPSGGDMPTSQGVSRGEGGLLPPSPDEGGPAPDAGGPPRGEGSPAPDGGLTKDEKQRLRKTLEEGRIDRGQRIIKAVRGYLAGLPVSLGERSPAPPTLLALVDAGVITVDDATWLRSKRVDGFTVGRLADLGVKVKG